MNRSTLFIFGISSAYALSDRCDWTGDAGECCSPKSCGVNDNCPDHSICKDECTYSDQHLFSDYQCICDNGFQMNAADECCDENQCDDNPCPSNASCQNDCVGYTCKCNNGLTAIGDTCVNGENPYANQPTPKQKQYSSAYEDPHFHVNGVSELQPDLCFDLNGPPGSKMVLIRDDHTGFQAVGQLYSPTNDYQHVFFQNIQITSPFKVILNINSKGLNCDTHSTIRGVVVPKFTDQSEVITYGDMLIGKMKTTKSGFSVVVSITGGPTFEVQSSNRNQNVNFRLLDQASLSINTIGVLGDLIKPNSYNVVKNKITQDGFLTFQNITVGVSYQRHAWNTNCWYIKPRDAAMLFQK